jgi:hypothetical protein
VVLCVFSVGYFVGLTVAQTGTITIEPNSFQTEASYIIFTDGTTIYARNGTTGAIDYSGTDASTVIQSAINALTNGVIFLKNGVYDVSSMSGASFLNIGDGKNIALTGEDNEKTVIKDDRDNYDFCKTFSGGTDFSSNVTFKNIKFDRSVPSGTTYHKYVIYGFKWNRLWIENCKFVGNNTLANNSSNKYLLGAVISVGVKEAYFLKNTVIDFQYGLVLQPATNLKYALFDKNYFENIETLTCGIGDCPSNANVLITNNICVDCGWTDEGISIDRGHSASSIITINGKIDGNIFFNSASKTGRQIAVISVSGVTVSNNRIYDLGTNKWGNRIYVGSSTQKMSDIIVRDNDIFASGYGEGIVFQGGVQSGQILNNRVWMEGSGDTTPTTVYCIRFIYDQAITYDAGKITVQKNYLATPTGSNPYRYGVAVTKSSGSGGSVDILVVGNTFYKCYRALTSTLPDTVLTVTVGANTRDSIAMADKNDSTYSIKYLVNSGTVYPANNGTVITHGLAAMPNLITLTLSGSRNFATGCYLLDPTVIATSSTTFTIELLYYNVTANAYYAVTPSVYNATIYWNAQI